MQHLPSHTLWHSVTNQMCDQVSTTVTLEITWGRICAELLKMQHKPHTPGAEMAAVPECDGATQNYISIMVPPALAPIPPLAHFLHQGLWWEGGTLSGSL